MKPSKEAIEAAEATSGTYWTSSGSRDEPPPLADMRRSTASERFLEAAYAVDVTPLEQERDLFRGCCERAFDIWREMNPEAKVWKDGAHSIPEVLQKLEQRVKELEDGKGYLTRLFNHIAPGLEPFDSLPLLATQIDNCIAGHKERILGLEARAKELEEHNQRLTQRVLDQNENVVELEAENQRLRRMLKDLLYDIAGSRVGYCGGHSVYTAQIAVKRIEAISAQLKEQLDGKP